ncbi:MAG: hypothetical protein ACC618_00655 [Patescibacteria group bacterium]
MLNLVNYKARILEKVTIRSKFVDIVFPLTLSILVAFVSWQNYTPGTWLSGWDNLHPEFNLVLNLKRSFFALWQEYQGLGLLGGMAHAADLPRQLILLAFSLFLPISFLRYFWFFLMLFAGPLGVYFLVREILGNKKGEITSNLSGLVAGAFYFANLATVQYFYTPYESFAGFYGFFPYLILFALRYLKTGKRKDIAILLLVSVLATSAFYVQTLFVVYLLVLSVFVLEVVLRQKVEGVKKSIKLLVIVLVANAFWLFPAGYFTLENSSIVNASKINSFSTPEITLMNQARGNLSDIALLRGFWFDYSDLGEAGKFDYLMSPWREHLSEPGVELVGYLIFVTAVLGLTLSFLKKNLPWRASAVILFVVSYFMLATVQTPFGAIYSFLSDRVPFFNSAFRSVFTKWSVVAAFTYALGLGFFIYALSTYLKGKLKFTVFFVAGTLLFGMIWFMKPSFEGHLIMKSARIKIPYEYFELFEFFKKQPRQARIAFFPVDTFWGWNFYDWGYRGSGFLWYGIEQPILDRAFDVWSGDNETFYNEFATAFYGLDKDRLVNVLDKYDVSFVLIDKGVISPEQELDFLRFDDAEKMLAEIGAEVAFEKEDLIAYDLRNISQESTFVFAPEKYSQVSSDVNFTRRDVIFDELGDYVLDKSGETIAYPFSDLWKEEVPGVSYSKGYLDKTWVNIKRELDVGSGDYELVIPGVPSGTIYQGLSRIKLKGAELVIEFEQPIALKIGESEVELPELSNLIVGLGRNYEEVLVSINAKTVRVSKDSEVIETFPLWVGAPIYVEVFDAASPKTIDLSSEFLSKDINTCWTRKGKEGFLDVTKSGGVLSIKVKDLVGCASFKLGRLEGEKALLSVSLPYRSSKQSRPDFCVVVEGSHECLNEEVFYNSIASNDWGEVERQVILETAPTYWLVVSTRPSDEEGEEWQIDYQAPDVESYPLVANATFDAGVWKNLIKERRMGVEGGESIDLSLYGMREEVDFALTGKLQIDNCDIFERGSVDKDVTEAGTVYRAENGASVCDFSPLGNITTAGNYLIRFVGENVLGRGLKFYLYNKTVKHNGLEVLLDKGEFDQTFSILDWLYYEPSTYVLNVENRSFGEKSEVELNEVEIYQLPLQWLTTWRFEPRSLADEEARHTNEIVISDIEKIGTSHYFLTTKSDIDRGLLMLSQGYEDGWQAFTIDSQATLARFLPWITGKKLEHTKVNSWANGWFVPKGEHSIVIVFWPQYLEFLGFAILFIAGSIFLKKFDKE